MASVVSASPNEFIPEVDPRALPDDGAPSSGPQFAESSIGWAPIARPNDAAGSEGSNSQLPSEGTGTPQILSRVPLAPIDPVPHTDFSRLGLSEVSLAAVKAAGYTMPTPVQAGLIPRALTGNDVIGQARTGTGKTAAFLLPIFERLKPNARLPQAIVLVPTRELAAQVETEANKLSYGRKISVCLVSGGKPIRKQMQQLSSGVELVVGTPGRVIDHINRGTLLLGEIQCVVLDEADRMLDIGFRPDIEKILRRCPQARQTLLLSATVPPPVERLAQRYMRDPEMVNSSPKDVSADTIDQYYICVDRDRKFDALVALLEQEWPDQAIVFCRTKRGTDKLTMKLSGMYEDIASIHGDMAQNVRDRVMARFRAGKIRVLVATDVMGRGIDVSGISHIINFDIPEFCDDYVHRVGRTGRAGRFGVAYTFVSAEEGPQLTSIEMRINKMLDRVDLPGLPMVKKPQGAPTQAAMDAWAELDGEEGEKRPPAAPKAKPKKYRRAL